MIVKGASGKRQEGWLQAGVEIQRLLREGWVIFRHTRAWEPPTDVYENEEGLVIRVEIAGMREEDFRLTLGERVLVIEGVREDREPKRAYYQMEIYFGEFRAEVFLPWMVDPAQVEAAYREGFLQVLVPRPPTRRVQILQKVE